MALKLDMKGLPVYVKAIIAVLPGIIIAALVIFLLIKPKIKTIADLDKKIDEQNNQISVSTAKAAKLDILVKENAKLMERLNELKEQLPEEKEISGLLKQVSDKSIEAGLDMKSWKPGSKSKHSSGIVIESPVAVVVSGTYHDMGRFLSSLTRMNRIVNVTNLMMGQPKMERGYSILNITFTASTFSSVPEEELAKKGPGAKGPAGAAPKPAPPAEKK